MHRSFTHLVAWILVAWIGTQAGAQAQGKFAFVDLNKCFNEYYKTKVAKTRLEEQAEEFNQERQKLLDEGKTLEEGFNQSREAAQNTALSAEVREEMKGEAEGKLVELREFEQKVRRFDASRKKQLDDQSRRMRKHLVEEIQQSIQEYARNHDLEAVLDSSGESLNGVVSILYVSEKLDITDAMLEILNKGQVQP